MRGKEHNTSLLQFPSHAIPSKRLAEELFLFYARACSVVCEGGRNADGQGPARPRAPARRADGGARRPAAPPRQPHVVGDGQCLELKI